MLDQLTPTELKDVHDNVCELLDRLDDFLFWFYPSAMSQEVCDFDLWDVARVFDYSYLALQKCSIFDPTWADPFVGDSIVSFFDGRFSSYHRAVISTASAVFEGICRQGSPFTHGMAEQLNSEILNGKAMELWRPEFLCSTIPATDAMILVRANEAELHAKFKEITAAREWLPVEFSLAKRHAKSKDPEVSLEYVSDWDGDAIEPIVMTLVSYSYVDVDLGVEECEPTQDVISRQRDFLVVNMEVFQNSELTQNFPEMEWNVSLEDRNRHGAIAAGNALADAHNTIATVAVPYARQLPESPTREAYLAALSFLDGRLCSAWHAATERLNAEEFGEAITRCKDALRWAYLEQAPELVRLANELHRAKPPEVGVVETANRPEYSRPIGQKELRGKLGMIDQKTLKSRLVETDVPTPGMYRCRKATPNAKTIEVVIADLPESLHEWLRRKPI